MRVSTVVALMTIAVTPMGSCDQTEVNYPENSSTGGVCGSWYPGGADPDTNQEYAIEEEATFPCLVWESVRKNKENTWVNVGDLYLGVKHGAVLSKALIIVKVGVSCAGCYDLVVELSKAQNRLSKVAVMIALTHGDVFYPDIYPLDEAEEIIVGDEGWPEDWYLTNDVENHFSESQFAGVPWVTVVELKNMRVVSSSNYEFSAANVDELVELVEGF